MIRKSLILYLLLLVASCGNADSSANDAGKKEDASAKGVPITEIEGSKAIYGSGIGLCETALRLGGPAGLYRVDGMTSIMETIKSGTWRPFTYVELDSFTLNFIQKEFNIGERY
jgi:hypothetical protein